MTDDHDWRLDAACRGTDKPDLFHPIPSDRAAAIRVITAFCRGCSVVAPCLDYARSARGAGVWGGLLRVDEAPRGGGLEVSEWTPEQLMNLGESRSRRIACPECNARVARDGSDEVPAHTRLYGKAPCPGGADEKRAS